MVFNLLDSDSLVADGILFDCDGVLIDSMAVIERTWRRWAEQHGLDAEHVLELAPGRRGVDLVRSVAPLLDAEEQARQIEEQEALDTNGVQALPGAVRLISDLGAARWAWLPPAPRRSRVPGCAPQEFLPQKF